MLVEREREKEREVRKKRNEKRKREEKEEKRELLIYLWRERTEEMGTSMTAVSVGLIDTLKNKIL